MDETQHFQANPDGGMSPKPDTAPAPEVPPQTETSADLPPTPPASTESETGSEANEAPKESETETCEGAESEKVKSKF